METNGVTEAKSVKEARFTSEPRPVTGRANGKLLLFGEHAAVHGYPAVGVSLSQEMQVSIEPAGAAEWEAPGLPEQEKSAVIAVIETLQQIIPGAAALPKGRITITSSIPRGSGFGSSAALCGALARAFACYAGNLTEKTGGPKVTEPDAPRADRETAPESSGVSSVQEWEWAHVGEKQFHGTPSGIDTGLSLHRGLYGFRMQPPALPNLISLPGGPLHLVIGAVPRNNGAKETIASIGRAVAEGEKKTRDILAQLGTISEEAIRLLSVTWGPENVRSLSLRELGILMNRAHTALSRLDLSTPELEFLLTKGKEYGALGGKLSGAGGGGAFYLLYRDERSARRAGDTLNNSAASHGIETAAFYYHHD